MGAVNDKASPVNAESKDAQNSDKPLKPCCACPETKKIRDEWYASIPATYKSFPLKIN